MTSRQYRLRVTAAALATVPVLALTGCMPHTAKAGSSRPAGTVSSPSAPMSAPAAAGAGMPGGGAAPSDPAAIVRQARSAAAAAESDAANAQG
ncbi:hypothetical protein [Phaeacidiphilus oryzae]|uniref:hypothetical protein n=1 Tax=Phaeacidiphilus oryzae TaxID=348818 RepID=UPI00056ADAFA|nr:hypothetical protein [Phaeacidiphilus oryzae]